MDFLMFQKATINNMNRRSELILCTIQYFYNVRQQNNYLLYDFSLPKDNKQQRIFQVNLDQLKGATKLEQALQISEQSLSLLEKKRRVYNFVIPFKFPNHITTHLCQLISDELTLTMDSNEFFQVLREFENSEKLAQYDDIIDGLQQFYELLKFESVREVYIICEPQEKVLTYYPFCYDNIDSSLPTEILENKLYLGGSTHAKNLKGLQIIGITHIVNCAKEIPNYYSDHYENNHKINYFHAPVLDLEEEPISDHFDEAYIFINEALNKQNNKILVHCAQGRSRSATIVVMYLMRNKQWTFDQAIEYAKKRRDIISINEGFQSQLLQI